jgi:hypothetical protein
VSGGSWSHDLRRDPQDYIVTPPQPWIDGFRVDENTVRQFVAVPLGQNYSVEEQITGKAEFGGLQILAYPLKAKVWARLVAERKRRRRNQKASAARKEIENIEFALSVTVKRTRSEIEALRALIEKAQDEPAGDGPEIWTEIERGITNLRRNMLDVLEPELESRIEVSCSFLPSAESAAPMLGLGAGGKINQEILKDRFSLDDWETDQIRRCFVTLLAAQDWTRITGEKMPAKPPTAKDYERAGIPWFNYSDPDEETLEGKTILGSIKSVVEISKEYGKRLLDPSVETSVDTKNVVRIVPREREKNQVSEPGGGVFP